MKIDPAFTSPNLGRFRACALAAAAARQLALEQTRRAATDAPAEDSQPTDATAATRQVDPDWHKRERL